MTNSATSELLTQSGTSELDIPFELKSLSLAVNYQKWVYRTISPYIGNRIIEIGAGIGNMSRWLQAAERLIFTETEPYLLEILKSNVEKWNPNPESKVHGQNIDIRRLDVLNDDLSIYQSENLDTVISFNVLEHIEDDLHVLKKLRELLSGGQHSGTKRIITFVPGHNWAYGTMDKSFGHFRRYSATSLRRMCRHVAPEARITVRYMNLVGLLGWYFSGKILRRKSIGVGSIAIFEKLCPFLSPIDDFLHKKLKLPFGQSLLAVMEWD